jgi:hypothetical protein
MLFRRNELKKLCEMNDLAFYNAENELIIERKRTPIGPQKVATKQSLCVFESKIATRAAKDAPPAAKDVI